MQNVLIVDDSPTSIQELEESMQSANFKVLKANDGDEAFEVLEQNPEISLLITDLNMPNLDGIGLVKKISNSHLAGKFPIVVVSTEFSSDLKIEGKKYGVKLWVVKPFQRRDFSDMMLKLLQNFKLAEIKNKENTQV
jgi:two-component system, chemotaxis family, chemotaxis protein CheY